MRAFLLPGLDGTGRLFKPFLETLPASIEPVVVSYPADSVLDYAALTDLVRQRLPADPVAIIAESFSGPIAIRLAAQQPWQIVALVLVGSFAQQPLGFLSTWVAPLIRSAPFHVPPPGWMIRRYLAGMDAPEELVTETIDVLRSVSPLVLARRVREALSVRATDDFAHCKMSTLYMSGTRDRLLSRGVPHHLKMFHPDLRIAYLDAPHFILQRKPKEAAQLVADFLIVARDVR